MTSNWHRSRQASISLGSISLLFSLAFASQLTAQRKPDYFPLHVGNKWTYELWTDGGFPVGRHYANEVMTITDTVIIQQKKYFEFEDKIYYLDNSGKVYRRTHYFRKSNGGDVMKFSLLSGREQLYYTLQRDSVYRPYLFLDEFNFELMWKVALIDTNAVISLPSSIFVNCYHYSFGLLINGDDRIRFTRFIALAPNIGYIYESAEGDLSFITGAYIDGKLIGDTTFTSVREIMQSRAPRHPALYQNYPNPFDSRTHIVYSIPDSWVEPVQIAIFDIQGREITTFTQTNPKEGLHEFLWSGTNTRGEKISKGFYIARLRSGQFSHIVKLNYLKQGDER